MSMGFGFSLPAYPLRGGGGNNPFNQSGPTLDLSFVDGATNVGDLSNPNGYTLNTNFITPQYQVAAQYVVWETGVGLVDKTFSQIVTFSRTSGATWFNSAGVNVGIDFSTSSVAIGTGSKTFTLTATAGVDRSWTAGDIVRISEQATPANFMDGTVTSYTASTQTLVVNVTATGGSGTIASWRVSNWMPRFDYDPSTLAAQGLLIEEQRTNSVLQSESTTGWGIGALTITTNATTAPTGTVIGARLVEDSTTNAHSTSPAAISFTSGTAYSLTLFAKEDATSAKRFLQLTFPGGSFGSFPYANFDLGAGTITAQGGGVNRSASIQAVGNGWYRCRLTADAEATASGSLFFLIQNSGTAARFATYTGNGTAGFFIFGAQLEAGAFPTSYIPTTVAQVTRNADVASVNTLSPWYNASAGTIYAEGVTNRPYTSATGGQMAQISDGTANNRMWVAQGNTTANTSTNSVVTTGATPVAELQYGPAPSSNLLNKSAFAYAANDFAGCANGGTVQTDPSGAVPTVTTLYLGISASLSSASNWNGYLRRIVYYPRRLSNAELQSITS